MERKNINFRLDLGQAHQITNWMPMSRGDKYLHYRTSLVKLQVETMVVAICCMLSRNLRLKKSKVQVFDTPQVSTVLRSNLMRHHCCFRLVGYIVSRPVARNEIKRRQNTKFSLICWRKIIFFLEMRHI